MKCRLLNTGYSTGYWNMACDEAMLEYVQETGTPVLRLYGWRPSCVSLGYFQSLEKQVDEKACRDAGVDIVRRITGGGTVYHKDELTYTIILPEDSPHVSEDILETYRTLTRPLISALKKIGVRASFTPLNDLTAGDKKISGNAQTRRKHCVLQHGTILLDVDAREMFSLLKVESEKMREKMAETVQNLVTSVKDETGDKHSLGDVEEAFAESYRKTLGLNYLNEDLNEKELEKITCLAHEKYGQKNWIRLR